MTKRQGIAIALGAILAACGGGSGGNAAIGKAFTYGTPTTASASQLSPVQGQVASALALQGAPDSAGAASLAQSTAVTSALLGDSGASLLQGTPARAGIDRARRSVAAVVSSGQAGTGGFDDPSCVAVAGTAGAWTVTFKNCTLTETSSTSSTRITADGEFQASAGKLKWGFTVGVTMTEGQFSATGTYHGSGDLTGSPTTLDGQVLAEVSAHASGGGQSASAAMSESLSLDIAYDPAGRCVTAPSTLEAKRVWTVRPSGATATDFPDRAATISWTGCGAGTIAFSR